MAKVKKLILVTAEHHPYHKQWLRMSNELAQMLGVELEVKIEDYVFAIEHGVTDEFGMAGLPQLLVELEDGKIKPLLYEIPLDSNFQLDFEAAKKLASEKLEKGEL
ncbi:MAG: hypothetical protein GU347_04275 [Desulfurococcales archaeon]|nr:hypothetical protein [Desulfurococcales archaeon]